MDYLRNLGSAAASSLLQKSGLTLPFSLGERVNSFEGKTIWSLYDGVKRDDSTPVSIFVFDANASNRDRRNLMPLAKNALRKLRTTRHPDVLKFVDAVETDTTIYVVTERVQPLGKALAAWQAKAVKDREEWLVWGLHRVVVALAFLNDSCHSTHGQVRVDSVFISPSGEWKLGGFDVLSSAQDEASVLYTLGGTVPDANAIASPEVKNSGWSALKPLDPACADAYALGLLLHSVFNPTQPPPSTIFPPHAAPPPSSRGNIPLSIFPSFKRLLNPNPKTRFTSKGFLALGIGEQPGDGAGFFANNALFKVCAGLEGFPLASEGDKATLLRTLKDSAASFPTEFASYKVLPSLLSSLEHGGASAPQVLPLILQLGKGLSGTDYTEVVIQPLARLFASGDRGTRMALLDNLPEYADKLDSRTVSDKIWPHLQTGFGDTVSVIREATVRSIVLIAPKLSDRILNNDLLRHLAKSQLDPEASIRTNTCILLGRLAPTLGHNTRRKVLVPAFTRSIKDSFVHARVSGLTAFMATIDCFEVDEMATKVIPAVSGCLIDREKLVRDQAFKTMEVFMKRVESHAASMPETVDAPEIMTSGGALSQVGIATSAAGAAGTLAGWAVSSITKKLATADLTTSIGGSATPQPSTNGLGPSTPTLSPMPSFTLNGSTPAFRPAFSPSPFQATPSPTPAKPKGMQLGSSKGMRNLADQVLGDSQPLGVPGGWDDDDNAAGGGDLMDVAADAGDWSEFSAAPGAPQMETKFDPDGWGDMLDPSESKPSPPSPPPAAMPNLSIFAPAARKAPAVPKAKPPSTPQPRRAPASVAAPTKSVSASSLATPTPPNPPVSRTSSLAVEPVGWDDGDSGWDDESSRQAASEVPSTPSLAGMSKEDKAAEMARRREERKQRIAQLKEQKKTGGKA